MTELDIAAIGERVVFDDLEIGEIGVELDDQEPEDVIEWAVGALGDRLAIVTAMQADGMVVLDMATKIQDAGEWTTTGGPGAGRLIAAFAERQWRLGETLSYRSIWAAATTTAAGPEADGGGATIVAKFADGEVQLITYDKFIYDCPAHAFSHVVMTAATAAG